MFNVPLFKFHGVPETPVQLVAVVSQVAPLVPFQVAVACAEASEGVSTSAAMRPATKRALGIALRVRLLMGRRGCSIHVSQTKI